MKMRQRKKESCAADTCSVSLVELSSSSLSGTSPVGLCVFGLCEWEAFTRSPRTNGDDLLLATSSCQLPPACPPLHN